MATSPNIVSPKLNTSYPAATMLQDGNGFAQGDLFDAGGNGGQWIFCVAAEAIVAGNAVAINRAGSASLLTKALANGIAKVGFAPVAVASGDFFWAQVSGAVAAMYVAASTAANVPLYTTATAGTLSDAASGQTLVMGAILTTAKGSGAGVAAGQVVNGGAFTANATLADTQFTTMSSGNGTLIAGAMEGARFVVLATSGATAKTTRTAAELLAGQPGASTGKGYTLRVYNTNGGTLTLTGGSGVTITGTATIATNVWRDYIVTFNSATTATMQNIGSGVAD